jgi:DNA-binding beta-propeller fold protein YncE
MVKRLLFVIVLLTAPTLHSQTRMPARKLPGGSPTTGYLLPNGWTVTPAGEQIPVGDLPLALALHPDGRHLLVSNNGNGPHSIDVIDVAAHKIVSRVPVSKAWLGLALDSEGRRVYAGGGQSNSVLTFSLEA